MNHISDIALLLTNRITPGAVEPLKTKEFWDVWRRLGREDLSGLTESDLEKGLGDAGLAERVSRLLGESSAFADARAELEEGGIKLLSPDDAEYPDRLIQLLRDVAPPVLYAAGPVEWLSADFVGVVGSRSVDKTGADVARAAATAAARVGAGVVSGGAKGVDETSMAAAHEAQIPCIGITAEGLQRASRRSDLRSLVSESRLLLVSPYAPGAGFSVGNAMGRNKLIYAMARVTLVVASDIESGGTWAGATEALRRGFGAVAVWTGPGGGPGNAALVERGATPVDDLRDWDPLETDMPERPAEISQLDLDI